MRGCARAAGRRLANPLGDTMQRYSMDWFPIIFLAIAVAVVGPLLFRTFKYKSFSAAMLGAPIRNTVGEIELNRSGLSSSVLKVHAFGLSDRIRPVKWGFNWSRRRHLERVRCPLSFPSNKRSSSRCFYRTQRRREYRPNPALNQMPRKRVAGYLSRYALEVQR